MKKTYEIDFFFKLILHFTTSCLVSDDINFNTLKFQFLKDIKVHLQAGFWRNGQADIGKEGTLSTLFKKQKIIWIPQFYKSCLEFCKVAALWLLAITPKFSWLEAVMKLKRCFFSQWLTYTQHIKIAGLKYSQ